ncbi:MAG: hypothetical protein WCF18_15540 [Chthoniobacteraceae bacterium]
MPYYDDPLVFYDDPAIFYDDPGLGHGPASTPTQQPLPGRGNTNMEYWEITKDRAQKTLAVWNLYVPTLTVGNLTATQFEALIAQYEPLAQQRTTALDAADEAVRAVKTSLLKQKILGTKVAQIIDGQLSSDAAIRDDLDDVFRIVPRSEPTILSRARALYPIWVRANTALGALTPPAGPITRPVQGTPHTAAMLKALLDGYTDLTQTVNDLASALNKKRGDLRVLNRTVDRASKDWYQIVKNTYDPGTPVYDALGEIPTEEGTPVPDAIEIDTVLQGGDDGLHVLLAYVAGGGDHATERKVEYQVVGTDADFGHTVDLDASGNALGPFTVGQVVKVRTKASNSAGTTTSAARTITIEEPL